MTETNESTQRVSAEPPCPPAAERAEATPPDPRGELLALADVVRRTRSASLLARYLTLRRLTRA